MTQIKRELAKLVEQARRNDAADARPRKHHLVPASYLRRWAEGGRVRVTEVDTRRSYLSSPEKAARQTDFYRMSSEDLDPDRVPPLLFETVLSHVEAWGRDAIDELIEFPPRPDPRKMANLAWFLAMQFARGAAIRAEQRYLTHELFKVQYCEMTDKGIERHLSDRGVEPTADLVASSKRMLGKIQRGELLVAPQDAALTGTIGEYAAEVGEHLLSRRWLLCRTRRVLVTCDEPVVPVGGPGFPRDERAGLANAGVVLFPLSPDRLLVMMRADLALAHDLPPTEIAYDDLDHAETAEIAREIIMSAHRWAFEVPARRVTERTPVPRAPGPARLEKCGVVERRGEQGELVRFYKPTRWRNAVPSDWPVRRWWV